jgi:hypothetical protein
VLQVFPRPKLDAALEARRLEREEATRQAKANLSKRAKTGFALRVPSSGQLAASGGESWHCIAPLAFLEDASCGLAGPCSSWVASMWGGAGNAVEWAGVAQSGFSTGAV